jgi:type IX secretion system PorP/SprF family membrane protein
MKHIKYLIGLYLLLSAANVLAQQDPMFTQYITNPVSINPAITGVNKISMLSLLYRKQWVGINGSPTTILLTFDGVPKYRNMGLGGSLIQDRIGPVVQTGLYFNYAYHVKFDDEKNLSLGLMGGANYYKFDLLSLYYDNPDQDIPIDGIYKKLLPNFGFGAFYYTPKYFLGFSIPKLLRNSLSDVGTNLTTENREERHMFVWAGMLINLNDKIRFKPSLIGRVVNGSPVSLDMNATFILYDKVWFGVLYRLGVTWGGLVRWQIIDNIQFGYSYDLSSSRVKGYGTGTHEIYISYSFFKKGERIISPRFF